MKALRVAQKSDLGNLNQWPVNGLLLDAKVQGTYGGTGQSFDWSILNDVPRPRSFILAGGLSVENVAEAVRRVRPYAVDVSSGVESEPGIKDPVKMAAFVANVQTALDLAY